MPQEMQKEDTLYRKIQIDFFRKVYSGEISPGQPLPPERKQAEELLISRGTVRKARKLLMDEGYISSTQGSAAVYTPLKKRKSGTLEIVAVVAALHNPFFMSYYRAFEKAAEDKDVLVMIKQLDSSNADQLEKVLFSLFLKGIRDIVFWPYDTELEYDYFQRLSGLGMNIVFFDKVHDLGFCDYISVDNSHAITSLYGLLNSRGASAVAYIGWDNPLLTSNEERERTFAGICSENDIIIRLPWNQEKLTPAILKSQLHLPDLLNTRGIQGILCGNGHIGTAVKNYLIQEGFPGVPLFSMDDFEESDHLKITSYAQPFDLMGETTFKILHDRHRNESWRSRKYYIKGRLIER